MDSPIPLPVFIAGDLVLHARDIQQLRTDRSIRRECFEACVDDGFTLRPVNEEASAVIIVIPALGPSFGTAPSGT